MTTDKLVLGVSDYGVLGATLAVSALIGLFFQFTNRKKTNNEFLLADKSMSSIMPVAFSLMATFFSATTIVGLPSEMYLYGTNMGLMNIGFVLGAIISAFVFLPVFVNNNVNTSYEYLEKRFGKFIRRIMSAICASQLILFNGATLYAPALALSAVTNLTLWMSIVSVGVVSTLYSTLGGMKAVIWADVFQSVLMFVTLAAICIKGCGELGGISNVISIANEGGRLVIPEFSFDMEAHYTFFNVLFHGLIITISYFGGGQIQIQRLLTLKSLKKSQSATLVSIPIVVAFQILCCFTGLVLYAHYLTCDPLSSPEKPIYLADQLMPYYITSTMNAFPGLPGLCVAGIFSASLSTVSSAVNTLASITLEDFVKPIYPNISTSVFIPRILSLVYGLICISLSFLFSTMGNLIRVTVLVVGMFAGPSLGVFILAACTSTTIEKGAVVGVLGGVGVAAFLSFFPEKVIDPPLPLSNECPDSKHLNSTLNTFLPYTKNATESIKMEKFHLAYMWISSIALLTCVISGLAISLAIRYYTKDHTEVPDEYLSPIKVWIAKKSKRKHTKETIVSKEIVEKCTQV